MFRHFSLAIFRLINEKKNLVNSYTRLACNVYIGEVRGEVGMRSRICCVGWVVWVQGFCYYMVFYVNIFESMVSSYACRDCFSLCNKFYTYLYHHIVVLDSTYIAV